MLLEGAQFSHSHASQILKPLDQLLFFFFFSQTFLLLGFRDALRRKIMYLRGASVSAFVCVS